MTAELETLGKIDTLENRSTDRPTGARQIKPGLKVNRFTRGITIDHRRKRRNSASDWLCWVLRLSSSPTKSAIPSRQFLAPLSLLVAGLVAWVVKQRMHGNGT